jgi:uncharacterized protein YndB with AHSA1/START domain
MEAWLPPEGMTGKMPAFEFKEGGGYRLVLTYDDPGYSQGKSTGRSDAVEVRFVGLEPDKRIVQAGGFESDNPDYSGEMTVTWLFEKRDGGTKVTVRCENAPKGISPEDHETGPASSLGNLARFAERRG